MTGHGGLVDAMAHPNDGRVKNPGAWMREAAMHGIADVLCVGVEPDIGPFVPPAPAELPRLWHATGLHPRWVRPDALETQLQGVDARLARGGVVAVGEIGLDGRADSPDAAAQERALLHQLRSARSHRLPVILHCVHRMGRMVEILEERGGAPHGAVLHGFTGPREMVPRFSALNVSFSFGGQLLNDRALRCREAAATVPDERLLVETDAPEIAPAQLPRLVECLATLRRTTAANIATLTATNARRLYKMSTLTMRFS